MFGYENMDLSKISSNIMTMSSDNDIPDLKDISDHFDNQSQSSHNYPSWIHEEYVIILSSNQIDSCMVVCDKMIAYSYCLFNISNNLQ